MTTNELAIDPATSILLLMDFQNGILANYPDAAPGLISRASDMLSWARSTGVHVGFVRVAFEDSDYESVPDTNKMFSALAASRRFPAADVSSQVIDELAPLSSEPIFRKVRVGAMSTTDMHDTLAKKGITTLILGGIATGGVVVSTVRDAADKDYRIVVIKDMCHDADPDIHTVLTEKLFPRQASVATASEFIAAQA